MSKSGVKGPEVYAFDRDTVPVVDSGTSLDRVTELLMDARYRRRKTILRPRLIAAISTLDTIAKLWDIQFLRFWIPHYCEYLTSSEGHGRKDIVDITKFSIDREAEARRDWINAMGKH